MPGLHDHDYGYAARSSAFAGTTQVVFGIILILLALLVECLTMLHAILGAVMLLSGIIVIALLISRRAVGTGSRGSGSGGQT